MNDWRHFYEGMEEESDCGGDFGDGMRRHLRQLALHRGSGGGKSHGYAGHGKVMSDDNLVLSEDMAAISAGEDVATTSTDYFAAVRLSRQQARDNAVNLLQEAMSYSESSKEAESAVELEQIVQTALSEAQIESLIIAKGYADCVAYMSGEGISIAVASPEGGLQREDVAVIADIVMAQSDYSLNDIRVVEVQ